MAADTELLNASKRFISIDPGKQGALVIWQTVPDLFKDSRLSPVGIVDLEYGDKLIDLKWAASFIKSTNPTDVIIEAVHTSSRMGVASAGNFMYSLGALHGTITSTGAELHTITPQKWKRLVGLYKAEKKASDLKFIEIFGQSTYDQLIKGHKNHTDRSEAALIGYAFFKLRTAKG